MQLSDWKEGAKETLHVASGSVCTWTMHIQARHSDILLGGVSILVIAGVSCTTTSTAGEFRNVQRCQLRRDTQFQIIQVGNTADLHFP